MASTWINDARGNRCSVEYWGSRERAQKVLNSLRNCSNCSNCSYCSYCSYKKESYSAPIYVPTIPSIHQTIYARVSQPNALKMDAWHTCDTTHCRAGWVVNESGEEGRALEEQFNAPFAAMLIYRESGYRINPACFYDSDQDALADMKRLAEEERASAAGETTKVAS